MQAHILLLEDNDLDREWIVEALESEGYKVHHAINGGEALKVIKDDKFPLSLAILDMKIEGQAGNQALSDEMHLGETMEMRRGVAVAKKILELRGPVPVIFASAYKKEGAEKIAREANYAGPWAYFDKEVISELRNNVLREAIRLAIQKTEQNIEQQGPLAEAINIVTGLKGREFVFNFNVRSPSRADGDGNAFIRYVIRKSALLYMRSAGEGVMRIFMKGGGSIDVSLTPARFRKQYQQFLEAYTIPDFLIEGVSGNFTAWINPENVTRYNSVTLYFDHGVDDYIQINEAISLALNNIFLPFRSG